MYFVSLNSDAQPIISDKQDRNADANQPVKHVTTLRPNFTGVPFNDWIYM